MKELAKKAAEAGAEKVKDKIVNDKRAELLEEFRIMQSEGKNIDNLFRRHRESIDRLSENRFVDLLVKLCPDGTNGR